MVNNPDLEERKYIEINRKIPIINQTALSGILRLLSNHDSNEINTDRITYKAKYEGCWLKEK